MLWLGAKANTELYSVAPFCLLLARPTVCTFTADRSGISRFPRKVFPSMPGVSGPARSPRVSRYRRAGCCLPLLACRYKPHPIPPHHLLTHSSATSVYLDVPVTIPIGDGTYPFQRFSPLAFNPNAPDLRCHTDRSVLAFRLKPKQSSESHTRIEIHPHSCIVCSIISKPHFSKFPIRKVDQVRHRRILQRNHRVDLKIGRSW